VDGDRVPSVPCVLKMRFRAAASLLCGCLLLGSPLRRAWHRGEVGWQFWADLAFFGQGDEPAGRSRETALEQRGGESRTDSCGQDCFLFLKFG